MGCPVGRTIPSVSPKSLELSQKHAAHNKHFNRNQIIIKKFFFVHTEYRY